MKSRFDLLTITFSTALRGANSEPSPIPFSEIGVKEAADRFGRGDGAARSVLPDLGTVAMSEKTVTYHLRLA